MRAFRASLLVYFVTLLPAVFATNEVARVFDGAGGASSNAVYLSFIAVGQPNPIGLSTNAGRRNHAGFLRAFVMFDGLDNDGDSIVDENDPDDDNDGLSDAAELGGGAFQPVTGTDMFSFDTDGDGASDGSEADAGTNPLDPFNALEIVSIQESAGSFIVTWKARDGRSYQLLGSTNVDSLLANPSVEGTVNAAGGIAPWFETLVDHTNMPGTDQRIYRVRLAP